MNCVVPADIDIDCNWKNLECTTVAYIDNLAKLTPYPWFSFLYCALGYMYTPWLAKDDFNISLNNTCQYSFKKLRRDVGLKFCDLVLAS